MIQPELGSLVQEPSVARRSTLIQPGVWYKNHLWQGGALSPPQWRIKGALLVWPPSPLTDQNFLDFTHFFWKIWRNRLLVTPGGLAPPPTGNPSLLPDIKLGIKDRSDWIFYKPYTRVFTATHVTRVVSMVTLFICLFVCLSCIHGNGVCLFIWVVSMVTVYSPRASLPVIL